MSKLHVTDDGRVLRCVASQRLCEFGSDRHFTDKVEATVKAEQVLQDRFDTLSTMKRGRRDHGLSPRDKRRSAGAVHNSRSLDLDVSLNHNRFGKVPSPVIVKEFAEASSNAERV